MAEKKFLELIRDKKGDTETLERFIQYFVFAILVAIFLFFFVNNSLSLEGQKSKILAKEIVLLIDLAKPGTQITVNTTGFVVSIDEKTKEVIVKAQSKITQYSYQFFSSNKIELIQVNNETIIKILE